MSMPLKKVIKSQRRQEKIGAEKHYKTARKQRISTYVSIITLNVRGLNVPVKRHRVTDLIKKKKKKDSLL